MQASTLPKHFTRYTPSTHNLLYPPFQHALVPSVPSYYYITYCETGHEILAGDDSPSPHSDVHLTDLRQHSRIKSLSIGPCNCFLTPLQVLYPATEKGTQHGQAVDSNALAMRRNRHVNQCLPSDRPCTIYSEWLRCNIYQIDYVRRRNRGWPKQ